MDIDLRVLIAALFVLFLLPSYIRDLPTLALIMMTGSVVMISSLIVSYCDMLYRLTTHTAAANCLTNWNTTAAHKIDEAPAIYEVQTLICGVEIVSKDINDVFLFFGIAIFSIEGAGAVSAYIRHIHNL